MARTLVYIDGFNLYYRALKGTNHKWLNLIALSQAALPATAQVVGVNYYTAHVSGRVDPGAPKRQHAYLRALETLPSVRIFFGNFLVTKKFAGLVQPPDLRPSIPIPADITPQVAHVWKTEEKGSDVNLGVHLVRDAALGAFEEAAVLTNDTDLVEPIRIVAQEFKLPVTLLTPVGKPSSSLAAVASSVRHIQPYLGPCQLPQQLTAQNGRVITRPSSW